jgi:hypothetical protein
MIGDPNDLGGCQQAAAPISAATFIGMIGS